MHAHRSGFIINSHMLPLLRNKMLASTYTIYAKKKFMINVLANFRLSFAGGLSQWATERQLDLWHTRDCLAEAKCTPVTPLGRSCVVYRVSCACARSLIHYARMSSVWVVFFSCSVSSAPGISTTLYGTRYEFNVSHVAVDWCANRGRMVCAWKHAHELCFWTKYQTQVLKFRVEHDRPI